MFEKAKQIIQINQKQGDTHISKNPTLQILYHVYNPYLWCKNRVMIQ